MQLSAGCWLLLIACVGSVLGSSCTESHNYRSVHETGHFGCSSYADRLTTSWLIQPTDPTQRILLEFTEFNTEANYDFVKIYDGDSDDSRLMGSFSGSVIPGPFASSSNSLYVVFTSDEYVEGTGFAAHWTVFQVAPGITRCESSEHVALEGPEGDFGCGGYANSISPSWSITGNPGERLVLSFDNFNTERDYDILRVYNGADTEAQLVGTFSGADLPPPITASGNQLYITFESDYSLSGRGFTASWSSLVSVADPCYNNTNTVLLAPQGYLGCPYGYANGVNSTWLINMVGDVLIQLDFLSLNLETNADFLDVYDGSSTLAHRLFSLTGLATPPTIRSSGNQLFLVLRANGNGTAGGFTASYQTAHAIQDVGCAHNGTFTLTAPHDVLGCTGYANQVTQEWLLVAQSDKGQVVNLVWRTFHTEDGHDFVYVYDGSDASAHLVYKHSGPVLPDPVQSSGSHLYIKFVADGNNIQGVGFSAIYESVSAPASNSNSCESSHANFLTDQEGSFGCSGYGNSVEITWQIQVQEGFKILLAFDSFFTEAAYDILTIYDGPYAEATELGHYSGAFRPPSVSSSSNFLFVVFTSDPGITRAGFRATYSSVFSGNYAQSCFESHEYALTAPQGGLGCAGYGANVDMSWAITTDSGSIVTLEFSAFQTETNYDVMTVYDGATESAPVLAMLSGFVIPAPVRSSSNHMLVVFRSDATLSYDGFTANYHAEFMASVVLMPCSTSAALTLTTPAGQLGCNGYENNVDSSWLIHQAAGGRVTLRFTQLDTEELYDYVKVYDGGGTAAALVGTYSGGILPPPFTSTSNQVFVTFHSDSSMSANLRGFAAEYASFDGPVDSLDGCDMSTAHYLTLPSGSFGCDGYGTNVVVSWQITSFASIVVNFERFSTEPNYDTVTIYDGVDDRAPILATFSGTQVSPVISTGRVMFVQLVSDASVTSSGFSANYATITQ